jgi:hypothetical protein
MMAEVHRWKVRSGMGSRGKLGKLFCQLTESIAQIGHFTLPGRVKRGVCSVN